MATLILDYTDASEFLADPALAEFTGSGSSLKLGPDPQTFNQAFTSDSGFTYDSAKAEFTGTRVQQKSQIPAGGRLGCNYASSLDAAWNIDGALTAVLNGTPTLNGGKLDCTGAIAKGVYYVNNRTTAGAIKFKYTPNYDVEPSTNIELCGQTLDQTDVDELFFFNSPSGGNIRVTARDSSGVLVANALVIGGYSFTDGVEVEILCQWDSVAGQFTVYVEGSRIGVLNVTPWTRGTGAGRCYVGAMPGGSYNKADGLFDDVLVFNAIQETGTSYTPGYSVDDAFAATQVDLPTFNYIGLGSILGYLSMATADSGVSCRYVVNGRYWTGSMWATSNDSYAEASTAADISDNLPTHNNLQDSVNISIFFPAGAAQNFVSNLDFNYNGTAYPSEALLISTNAIGMTALLTFLSNPSSFPALTNVKFFLSVGGVSTWFNGVSWATSDGSSAQSNTVAEMMANVATLDLSAGPQVFLNTWLISDDGSETPTMTSVTMIYNFSPPFLTPPELMIIYGQVFRMDGELATNATLRIESLPSSPGNPFFAEDGTVQPGYVDLPTDASGIVVSPLIISSKYGRRFKFTLFYTNTASNLQQQTEEWGFAEIPDQVSANVEELNYEAT